MICRYCEFYWNGLIDPAVLYGTEALLGRDYIILLDGGSESPEIRCTFVDYVEPATNAPFHIESDDLKMIDNDERLNVSCYSFSV